MNEKKTTEKNQEVQIKQINPRTELNELEKTAILQFEIEKKEEELGKTSQFKILNSKQKNNGDLELPSLKNGKKNSLSETIKIKLSDLRAAIDQEELEMPSLKKKKSLYDTVIIKLDDIINSKSVLRNYTTKKVTNVEYPKKNNKKSFFRFKRNLTKSKNFKLNVMSDEFGSQLYNLNRIALTNLSKNRNVEVRKNNILSKLDKIEKIHISKSNYLKYQKNLNKFAINKLYYKYAPKESKRYRLYQFSVVLSGLVFILTSTIVVNWFIQGASTNNLSHALIEDAPIVQITDGGELVNMDEPIPEENEEYSNKQSMYWRYLNTPLSSVDFTELLKQNNDTVGWMIVNNTNVNYPVVQTTNNEYYLKHSFDKSSNSAGWVYADFRDDFDELSKNTVIYAHGRKDKVMFGSLTNTLDPKWYQNKDNQIIQFSTLKYNTMWQIISIYKIQAESYYITTDFSSSESFGNFVNTMKSRSIYDFGVDVTKDDKLLTLSTCYNDNGIRLVVQAKLVKIQER